METESLQQHLITLQEQWKFWLAANNFSTNLCLHLAPDMCWCSIEHETREHIQESLEETPLDSDTVSVLHRLPPACHTVITKI